MTPVRVDRLQPPRCLGVYAARTVRRGARRFRRKGLTGDLEIEYRSSHRIPTRESEIIPLHPSERPLRAAILGQLAPMPPSLAPRFPNLNRNQKPYMTDLIRRGQPAQMRSNFSMRT
jgi:hypothetical protein